MRVEIQPGVSDVDLAIPPGAIFRGVDSTSSVSGGTSSTTLLLEYNVDLVDELVLRPGLKHIIAEEGVPVMIWHTPRKTVIGRPAIT